MSLTTYKQQCTTFTIANGLVTIYMQSNPLLSIHKPVISYALAWIVRRKFNIVMLKCLFNIEQMHIYFQTSIDFYKLIYTHMHY